MRDEASRAQHWLALRTSLADRLASAAARRLHADEVRAAVRTQLADNQLRRQAMAHALAQLRQGLIEFRTDVRTQLRAIGVDVTSRRTRPQPGANHESNARQKPV
jgi:hypothetical protein